MLALLTLLGALGWASELAPYAPLHDRDGVDAEGIVRRFVDRRLFVLLPPRKWSRPAIPDVAGQARLLGSDDFYIRQPAHSRLAAAFMAALDADPTRAAATLAEIRRRLAAEAAVAGSVEATRRIEQLDARAQDHANGFVCRCRARCPDGRETEEFSMDLDRDRCWLHSAPYLALAGQCGGRGFIPDDYERFQPRAAACRVAQGPPQPR